MPMIFSLSDMPHARLLPSQEEMRGFDRATIAGGIDSSELMERAGVEVFRELKERFSFDLYSNGRVAVLAGPGNNGGDGMVIARHLKDHGYEVAVILATSTHYSPDLLNQFELFRQKEGAVFQYPEVAPVGETGSVEILSDDDLQTVLRGSSVIVDALLGTGQSEAPRGSIAAILKQAALARRGEEAPAKVVAVDIPTGINGDTGEVYDGAIPADLTVAIELIKRGMMQYPARAVCGDIWVVKIGLTCDRATFSVLDKAACRTLDARLMGSHKGDFGSVLVIGGSENMPGAPVLSAVAALRSGVGSVIKAHLRSTGTPGLLPEIMLACVGKDSSHFTPQHLELLERRIEDADALILGPGMGTEPETIDFVGKVVDLAGQKERPLLIDADALNCLALLREQGRSILCPGAVLTPHAGEMGRLLGISSSEVQRDRYDAALTLAKLTGATVVLKGAATLIVTAGQGWVNTSGNPWLAVPGSGDVLCGVIAALLARGFSASEAACSGVSLHGRAGDLLAQQGAAPFLASDLSLAIARLIGEETRES